SGGSITLSSGKSFGSSDTLPRNEFKVSTANLANAKFEMKDLGKLNGLKSLWHLSISSKPVTDSDLAQVQDLPKLEVLLLEGTRITAAGILALQRFPRLRGIHSSNFAWDSQLLAEVIAAHPDLTELSMNASRLT